MDSLPKIKVKYFMCAMCGKQYKTRGQVTHHVNSKCGTLKQFKCKICCQELMSAGSLHNHMLRHKGERSFMCPFCAKLFFTAGQLKVHERIHTQDKAYVCEICDKGFCHRQSLITHSSLHTGVKPYQCENCGNSFSCVGNLIKHRKTHADTCGLIPSIAHRVKHPSTKIKVKINTPANSRLKTKVHCPKLDNFTDKTENETSPDVEIHAEKLECCSNCGTSAPVEELVAKNNVANGTKHTVCCRTCATNTNFLTSPDLENSTQETDKESSIPQNDNANFSNDQNDNGNFSNESSEGDCLKTNNVGTHKKVKKKQLKRLKRINKDPDYEILLSDFLAGTNFARDGFGDCKHCGKRYMNARWLYKHTKDHESNDKMSDGSDSLHRCSCCKLSFATKEETLIHQQCQHADILTCRDCSKIFANRDSLRSHHKVFHKGHTRKTYTYVCDKCGKHFKQKSYLTVHEEQDCNKTPSFECSVCKKQFLSRYTRQNHMRVHDPEKKYLCKFCGKSFHWKGQLKIHERSHTGEKPFACLYCPKTFTYRESLLTHSTLHTGVKPHLCEGCGARFSCIGNLIKHRLTHAAECGSWTYSHRNE